MTGILDLMRAGVEGRFTIHIRQWAGSFRPLTVYETITITSETQKELTRLPALAGNAIAEHVIYSIKTLEKATTSSPDRHDPKITTLELQALTPEELQYLFKEYVAACDRVSPRMESLSAERLNELLTLAKKNPSTLIELSFSEVVAVCQTLLTASPTDR